MSNEHLDLLMGRALATGEGPPSPEDLSEIVKLIGGTPGGVEKLLHNLVTENFKLNKGMAEIHKKQQDLKKLLERMMSPPWHTAIYLKPVLSPNDVQAMVFHNGSNRVVNMSDEVDPDSLAAGDEVFLSNELNFLVRKSPYGAPRYGETAFFERYTEEGRVVVKWRDEEVVLEAAAALNGVNLEPGDQVRWDRSVWMTFEKIARPEGQEFLMSEIPDVGVEQVGGQSENLKRLLAIFTGVLLNPEEARRFGLDYRMSAIMVGPPGCGKTLMAKVVASEISRQSGKPCQFFVVKPGQWESPWVGETQGNIRRTFRAAKEAGEGGYAILFLDEIDSIGMLRGGLSSHHSDKFLGTLLAEMDGFSDRGDVALITATNRKDSCDPALLERLSDIEIQVARPDLRGARSIFEIHLPPTLPYRTNGSSSDGKAREEIIDTAVSRLYSPNARNEICKLRFRDGKTRTVAARELASGRLIRQICRAARQGAFRRRLEGGYAEISVEDMDRAVSDAMDRLRTTLTPRNTYAYLQDLPQDVDVVSVEPIQYQVKQSHDYLMLNVA